MKKEVIKELMKKGIERNTKGEKKSYGHPKSKAIKKMCK